MGTCERRLQLDVPADVVWSWLRDPQNLFSVNIFHAEVRFEGDELEKGSVIDVAHDFFGVFKQERQCRIREIRENFVAFGEHKAPDEPGKDAFPHNQSFEVVPLQNGRCELVNRLTGRYIFPGAKYVGDRLFRRYMPVILDDDNKVIAAGCGAIDAADVKTPKGLLLWPLMGAAARFTKKSTRRDVLAARKAHEQRNQSASPATAPDGTPGR